MKKKHWAYRISSAVSGVAAAMCLETYETIKQLAQGTIDGPKEVAARKRPVILQDSARPPVTLQNQDVDREKVS